MEATSQRHRTPIRPYRKPVYAANALGQLLHGRVLQVAYHVEHNRRVADIVLMEEAAAQAVLVDEKSPAELHDELMHLFREARAIGAVVEVGVPRHACLQDPHFHSSLRKINPESLEFETVLVSRHAWRQAPDFQWPFLLRRGSVPGPRLTLKGLVGHLVGLTVALGAWSLGAWSRLFLAKLPIEPRAAGFL
jgi:hypothetical protein